MEEKGLTEVQEAILLSRFSIENNTKFRRDEDNLYTTVDLDLYTALLGGEIIGRHLRWQSQTNGKTGNSKRYAG